MKRWIIVLIITASVGVLGLYFLNPYGTATWDPRARLFGYTTYHIPSASMAPTLMKGDYIMVQTAAYASKPPKSGEIIVFRFPRDRAVSYVRRVSGAPGDKLAIKDGQLYLNGNPIQEPYLTNQPPTEDFSLSMDEIVVPQGQLFVLGDNRDNSNDSRFWGFLPVEDAIGKVVYIWMADDRKRVGKVH